MTSTPSLHIIGAGLAGSEAALQLAKRGYEVYLYDMKPDKRSPAHHSDQLAEIVCSNSLGSQNSETDVTASGLLKDEMTALDCELLQIARDVAVPAGKALAVDRERFSQRVTETLHAQPNIHFIAQDVQSLPEPSATTLIATGPMTSSGLTDCMARLLEREQLYFFDAAAPIILRDSINFERAFYQDRYAIERQEASQSAQESNNDTEMDAGSYINCPLEKSHYNALIDTLLNSEKTELKSFEKESACYFESCLPVEVLASRGRDTLRFGPMKPVGIVDPHTGKRPYAVIQLRQDNAEGTLYNIVGFQTNLKWGAQKEMIQSIPGLENAEVVRYGVMHRNTFIHSPEVLQATLQLKKDPNIFFAGQLTGTEGYTESIATGLYAALNMDRHLTGKTPILPPVNSMLGSLVRYITRPEAINKSFQPINSNWGILPALPEGSYPRREKKVRNKLYVERSLQDMNAWIAEHQLRCTPLETCR